MSQCEEQAQVFLNQVRDSLLVAHRDIKTRVLSSVLTITKLNAAKIRCVIKRPETFERSVIRLSLMNYDIVARRFKGCANRHIGWSYTLQVRHDKIVQLVTDFLNAHHARENSTERFKTQTFTDVLFKSSAYDVARTDALCNVHVTCVVVIDKSGKIKGDESVLNDPKSENVWFKVTCRHAVMGSYVTFLYRPNGSREEARWVPLSKGGAATVEKTILGRGRFKLSLELNTRDEELLRLAVETYVMSLAEKQPEEVLL